MRMIAGARETLVIESPYLLGDRLEREIVARRATAACRSP